jgi:hypothetical protein
MHHLTNWMGDDGFLVRHATQIRHHNVVGDTIRISGRVVDVGADDIGRTVTIEQVAHNQHGNVSATGRAVVRLPSR